ncbi:hypothetical protein BH11MYX1_BH11MYX1_25890 [soil metagenome]
MARRDRIIFLLLGFALTAACATNKKDVKAAQHSLYDVDFALVYSAALTATRDLYPNLDDNPGPGKISTSWHQVQYSNCAGAGSTCDDSMANQQVISQQQGVQNGMGTARTNSAGGMPTRLTYKRYFIRFEVHVLGGRPWRVKVTGHASAWDPGAAMPVELRGADKPHWLEGRTEALQVAIWKRINKYAIPMKEEAPAGEGAEAVAHTDPKAFKNVPAGAATELAAVKDVLAKRAYGELRTHLSEDTVWSLEGGEGADAAMAVWQTDPTTLEAMAGTLGACAADGDKRVLCPSGQAAPGAWQLTLELLSGARGTDWKITSFVKAE